MAIPKQVPARVQKGQPGLDVSDSGSCSVIGEGWFARIDIGAEYQVFLKLSENVRYRAGDVSRRADQGRGAVNFSLCAGVRCRHR